jgi:hypothetical protein
MEVETALTDRPRIEVAYPRDEIGSGLNIRVDDGCWLSLAAIQQPVKFGIVDLGIVAPVHGNTLDDAYRIHVRKGQ